LTKFRDILCGTSAIFLADYPLHLRIILIIYESTLKR